VYNRLASGNRILIVTDSSRGAELAQHLRPDGVKLAFVIDPTVTADDVLQADEIYRGRAVEVSGHLGDFRVTIQNPETPRMPSRELHAAQVVITSRDNALAFKPRTGLHLLKNPSEGDLVAAAEHIRGLIGEFLKPVHVDYQADTCAGGVADHEVCGVCVNACPYDAISRAPENHLRMKIDHMACEGCGACVSACPTTSLRFAEPSPGELYTRLAALLAPVNSRSAEERLILLFHCGEQGRHALEEAGERPLAYPANLLPVEVPCLRYVSEANMLAGFRLGAAGVALLGCETCPHGERQLLRQKYDFCSITLDAFGLGRGRLALITAGDDTVPQAIETLSHFAERVEVAPVLRDGERFRKRDNREVIADAIAAFIAQTGREPGPQPLDGSYPFAFAEVRASGCTLCRSCVNVCPTHAFRYDENSQSIQFRHISCVACGLCEQVCPEKVITLAHEVRFDHAALEYQTVVQDEMVSCAKCGKPYINRKALETVEARLFSLESLLDTFTGDRRKLLRMCPDCRAAVAMLEVEKGWKP
jgi:ferredoxin